jgi:hypothetical protein
LVQAESERQYGTDGRTIVALCVYGNPLLTAEFHAPLAIRDMLINVQSSDFDCEEKSESG